MVLGCFLRLIFVNRFYWPDESATSLMLTDLARGLAAAGHEVHVLTSRQLLENPDADLAPREQHAGVHIHRLLTTRFGRQHLATRALDYLSFYLSALLRLTLMLRRGDTVIAKTDPPLISVIAALAAKVRGARLINWLQDVYPETAFRLGALRESGPLACALLRSRNWSLRRASTNVVVGERMSQFIEHAVPGCAPVTVIPNWSQALAATPVPRDDNPLRQQLGLQGKVVFGYSGNLGRAHEFRTLLEAATQLRGHEDIHFLIIGSGAQAASLQAEVQARGLNNWSFLPYQPREHLADSLGAADVHLVSLNPLLEGLIVPSKVYGVLAASRPALFIGAQRGELARLLSQHEAGRISEPGEAAALAACMTSFADDPQLRRRMGENALRASRNAHQAASAIGAWQSLLAADRRPGAYTP